MTDNRTTELLCKLLDEHGTEYEMNVTCGVSWTDKDGHPVDTVMFADTLFISHVTTPEQAVAATLGSDEPPYDELLRCLENDWHIRASWDGLRKFWCIELTEDGVNQRERVTELESLVRFLVPFFESTISHDCGCPDGYFEPHGCDDGCKALKELDERMKELKIEVD